MLTGEDKSNDHATVLLGACRNDVTSYILVVTLDRGLAVFLVSTSVVTPGCTTDWISGCS